MSLCFCGSQLEFSACCQPIHLNPALATTPQQLMRARFCAHITKNVDFVVDTYHPSCQAEKERNSIADSIDGKWTKLEVTNTENGANSHEGYVTFKAYLEENGFEHCLSERSRFLFENEQWYYVDGELDDSLPPRPITIESSKVGRNDPCPCGSKKKHKKCCG
ncbi:YchJ family metal-binding protein [Vibrio sp. 10N.261.51.F12]|uniref:YchJ family metal-binding protein n=1 Tax=Vibrio sp. 10N.261.51.F12 TaxID=3229679 RepID=UPI00354E5E6A